MTSTNTLRDTITRRETSNISPLEQRTTSNSFSNSNNRLSSISTQIGEQSTTGSNGSSLTAGGPSDDPLDGLGHNIGALDVNRPVNDGKSSHRSHRSRNSGGFLLSNAVFEAPTENGKPVIPENSHRQRHSVHDSKEKVSSKSPEKIHTKNRSHGSLGAGVRPLAANGTHARISHDSARENADGTQNHPAIIPPAVALDVDSAQIVNLALNLSENRRNASRRVLSTPLPPTSIGESFAGGSLRQHLQQQRRSSRNVSPKPDRGERAMTSSPRVISNQRINSPLQASFDNRQDGSYQYQFSASTLARAEKAKKAIELMAQYRRLLQYLPPLKPQSLERPSTAGQGTSSESPISSGFAPTRSGSASASSVRHLGRPYNPLQYIRNRKVRARNSRAIDGEAQGFDDLEQVSNWIDEVSKVASSEDIQVADCLAMPAFSKEAEHAASPHASPQANTGKSQQNATKVKRPRIDWVTTPADMLADVFWLEQDDNKKMIENRHGQLIFPQDIDFKRPTSRRNDDSELKPPTNPVNKYDEPELDLGIDAKLPEFKSIKSDPERQSDSATSKARQKLRDVRDATRIHHGRNSSGHEHLQFLHSRSRSSSNSSDSDLSRPPGRRRSGTADSHDRGKDILEKQMMEMLAKEAKETSQTPRHSVDDQRIIEFVTRKKSIFKDDPENSKRLSVHSRSPSLVKEIHLRKDSSVRNGSSGRASLDVPGVNPRRSLEGLDSTAPNSPQTTASKIANTFIPSIAMDLSPAGSRNASPTRTSLSKVRSKIRPFYERNQDSTRGRLPAEEISILVPSNIPRDQNPESPVTPERRKRSSSPIKKITSRRADDIVKPVKKTGSIRRGKGDESSGIKGLFKGSRNPVARVGDLLWKKEPSAVGTSSGFSTDESDIEDIRESLSKTDNASRESSTGTRSENLDVPSQKERSSFLNDLPVFTSPFDRPGRSIQTKGGEILPESGSSTREQRIRQGRRKSSRVNLIELPPRIDVQNASPTSSPDTGPVDRFNRDSSISDIESRRGSFADGVHSADARLNAILGLPGKRRNALPVTGLASLETNYNGRPSLEGRRQWSISDRGVSVHRGPMTKREIARVKALLLSSGIKAREISRRAAEVTDLKMDQKSPYNNIAFLAKEDISPVPRSQEHLMAAKILSDDIQISSEMWHASADTFCNSTVTGLLGRIEELQSRLVDNLTPMTRKATDDADEVSKDLVTSQTLKVKRISDKMDKMLRRRRRRLRWLRRGGWVLVEWALVGVMWYVWFMVVLVRVILGIGNGIGASLRWLFWL